MADVIIIRLHPAEPTSADKFTAALQGLTITAFELSFNNSTQGEQIGQASGVWIPPNGNPDNNPDVRKKLHKVDFAKTRILQHYAIIRPAQLPPSIVLEAVATAVIPVANHKEYQSSDIRLELKRNNLALTDIQISYNSTVTDPGSYDPIHYYALGPSTYIALPTRNIGLDPNVAWVQLPGGGLPPHFDDLKEAIRRVLDKDPAKTLEELVQEKPLTPAQCTHIANEIIWNRDLYPLPAPKDNFILEALYTKSSGTDDDNETVKKVEQVRKQFEGELAKYYATHSAEATHLANYVAALAAAIYCEARSTAADRAGYRFPVRPDAPAGGGKIVEGEVILTQTGGIKPSFTVPAQYFYALGATWAGQTPAEQRYHMAIHKDEDQLVREISDAIDAGFVQIDEVNATDRYQAARRLCALGRAKDMAPIVDLNPPNPLLQGLLQPWLDFKGSDILLFWQGAVNNLAAAYLDLELRAVTENYDVLIGAVKAIPVNNIDDLADLKAEEWRKLVFPPPQAPNQPSPPPKVDRLPPFTQPGTPEERTAALITHVRHFFTVGVSPTALTDPVLSAAPLLEPPSSDVLAQFMDAYKAHNGAAFEFSVAPVEADLQAALNDVFRSDPTGRAWLKQILQTLLDLYTLTNGVGTPELQFSLMESLYARGFTTLDSVRKLSKEDFSAALTGSVAFEYASIIYENAPPAALPIVVERPFKPINPDGKLVDCIPPSHLSPLGPVEYLHELLQTSAGSTCENWQCAPDYRSLHMLIRHRRGPLGELHVTRANLETPLPLIDLVNENLEALASAALPGTPPGVIYDTAGDSLAGHKLRTGNSGEGHDPAILFAAVPEHSSPATPVALPAAYDKLKADFSAPCLPYSQPLDICRSYLRQFGTTRYAAMRRFRKEITEFVLDPERPNEPAEFQRHLWRYPVRIDIAREYLGITPEEYDLLFTRDIALMPAPGQLTLRELYGFAADTVGNKPWTDIVVRVPEFLARTGLTYCEFYDLWRSELVRFRAAGESKAFPVCQPCCPANLTIQFEEPADPNEALKRLAIFIRLWRKLQTVPSACYSFAQLRDICDVLRLYVDGAINPDFVRQLAAFQMLRDHLSLPLNGGDAAAGATGAERTHLLALWVGQGAARWAWALHRLLDGIEDYAEVRHQALGRPPELLKLIAANLDPLSVLVGFDPNSQDQRWNARPTHTLRFAEVLTKIYASGFSVGEILFLFTADAHLPGDDPFPLQDENEALESPLDLPDNEEAYSLWALRRKLLAVEVTEEQAQEWSWPRIEAALRDEFAYVPPAGVIDPLQSLAEHFFPSILESLGTPVDIVHQQYRVGLVDTSSLMWNTPPDGTFHYDNAAQQLWTQLPLCDKAVAAKLGHIRQLKQAECNAVHDLYFMPRANLVPFSYVFANFAEAEARLIGEPNEAKRWAYFQREFARFYARCQVIAEHLASHVAALTDRADEDGAAVAWRLLRHLLADENRAAAPWEMDAGHAPLVTWGPLPNGGAFAALLGLTGTGLLGEYCLEGGAPNWRETRGPMSSFGHEGDEWNSPVPTILPALDFAFAPGQEHSAALRNGFAMRASDGAPLGGAQGYTVRWSGMLLVELEGKYDFWAGAPTPDGTLPDFEAAEHRRWRVTLQRGQKSWILLNHGWPGENAPDAHSHPLVLRRGAYRLVVEFQQPENRFTRPEDMIPQRTGFQLKYAGPDSENQPVAIPLGKLFRDAKDETLNKDLQLKGAAQDYLNLHYTSTLRDIRRTYQRAFKALLFAHRFRLSAKPLPDDVQSELGYMLDHGASFAGSSYYRHNGGWQTHHADLNFNLLPIREPYAVSPAAPDQRVQPSVHRRQALFDWWERIFDYTMLRHETRPARESPAWMLFYEAAERQPDDPADLLRHVGVDIRHVQWVLKYFDDYTITIPDLEDERWAVRAWHGEKWSRALLARFAAKTLGEARPDLWASDDPGSDTGNENLTRFVREGSFENGEPRRYEDVKLLNDELRERARAALLAYLCGMGRITLPWGGSAHCPKDLSDLLLLDVETGLCERASRIEEAISAVQTYVQRGRLGLEQGFVSSPAFVLLWDRRFATFHVWQTCRRRELYRENWIGWDEIAKAESIEAFRFLEAELRRSPLTIPVPGGLQYWPAQIAPSHPGLTFLQEHEPAGVRQIAPRVEGFDLLGTTDRRSRPSWLAALSRQLGGEYELMMRRVEVADVHEGEEVAAPRMRRVEVADVHEGEEVAAPAGLPFWIRTAIRLGVRFVRVAAAGEPPASTSFEPYDPVRGTGCCVECDKPHPAVIDEFYFWLMDTRYFDPQRQEADLETADGLQSAWHESASLPKLLHWQDLPMVHLMWARVHNGEFQQPRRSGEGVRIDPGKQPTLEFMGRTGDSLRFKVTDGQAPDGYAKVPEPGFRYDLAVDAAIVLPQVVEPDAAPGGFPGKLAAYPYFAYSQPGFPVTPTSLFSPAIVVAGTLRAHCHFEAALKWYELFFNPLASDNTWLQCQLAAHVAAGAGDNPCGQSEGEVVSDKVARQRSITLLYLETLLRWGDALMQRNSPEAFQQARLIYDTATRILGAHPENVLAAAEGQGRGPQTVGTFLAQLAPLNPRLIGLYELVDDRLALIHACLNAHRLRNGRPNIDMPYWGNAPIRMCRDIADQTCYGWQPLGSICPDDDWCCPHSPYRFIFLVQKAQEIANEVRGLGTALLAAYEKGDAEHLASLRATYERQLLDLAQEVRQNQWRAADWQVQALQKSKEAAQTNRRYYAALLQNGLNSGEQSYQSLTGVSIGNRTTGNVSESVAQGAGMVPDFQFGVAGLMGTPLQFNQIPIGTKLAAVFSTAARIMNTLGDITNTNASLSLTQAGWERRAQEWQHQIDVLDIDIQQIERQILAAERQRSIALRELNNHQRQMEHAREVQDFLRDKFTNHALYLWLQQETAALHYQMYELALHSAHQAQRAFNYERGHTARVFIPAETWDNLHEGLLAGERLSLAIRQMEKAYLDQNLREYELTKHISLRQHFPLEFLQLKATGYCEVSVPEWMFDLDYPGHYMRRIKNVTLTIPAVVGPYMGIRCRLTLLSSTTRVDPRLTNPPPVCCDNGAAGNGYQALAGDPRIVKQYATMEAIATSSGQNDAGLFELSFRDERYLPFEFAGAVSRWRLELPPENNFFDIETVGDVVLHLNYTSREGGDELRKAATEVAREHLPADGWRLFDIRQEFPDLWHQFQSTPRDSQQMRQLKLRLGRDMFPFLPGRPNQRITRLGILFEAPGAVPSTHQHLEFLPSPEREPFEVELKEGEILGFDCIASTEWPGLYHGVLDIDLRPFTSASETELGIFGFPAHTGPISRVYLFCVYETIEYGVGRRQHAINSVVEQARSPMRLHQ